MLAGPRWVGKVTIILWVMAGIVQYHDNFLVLMFLPSTVQF